jgi:hypothetical protein
MANVKKLAKITHAQTQNTKEDENIFNTTPILLIVNEQQ